MGEATGRSMGIAIFYWFIELPIEPSDLPSTVLFNGLCTRVSKGRSFQQANQQAAQWVLHHHVRSLLSQQHTAQTLCFLVSCILFVGTIRGSESINGSNTRQLQG